VRSVFESSAVLDSSLEGSAVVKLGSTESVAVGCALPLVPPVECPSLFLAYEAERSLDLSGH
jgi:hypothetical protein